ncbi:LOW QUALITY PROTEIN: high affinity choline transporter 1-like [Anableps anableps]
MVAFYLLVMAIGIWASVRSRRMERTRWGASQRGTLAVGVFTMTATCVGGAFIIGVARLVWALVPLQMSLSFITGGLFFEKPMRDKKYITMMDPFQKKYGKTLTGLLAVVPFISEVMCVPVTLISLAADVSVLRSDCPLSLCTWSSAAVAILHRALTDVIQLSLVFCGLWLCAPFVLESDVYADLSLTAFNHTHQAPWLGRLADNMWTWIDNFLAMSIGNLAFQDFHQRTLSLSPTFTARMMRFIAAGVVIILGIPPVLKGAVAASTEWNMTSYGSLSPYERGEAAMVLSIVLLHLTPTAVFVVGLGAIAGAAMSSTDSCLLAATSIFTTNIYKMIRNQVSDREPQWVIRITILVVGVGGTSLTYLDSRVLAFWILSSDLTYTIMLPQLICVLFIRVSNSYGATAGYVVAFPMRVLCGEPVFSLPAVLHFPDGTLENGVYIQRWPFKTIYMLSSLFSIVAISNLASLLLKKGILPESWDVFKVNAWGASSPPEEAPESDNENEKNCLRTNTGLQMLNNPSSVSDDFINEAVM